LLTKNANDKNKYSLTLVNHTGVTKYYTNITETDINGTIKPVTP